MHNAEEAVRLAKVACQQTRFKDPAILDTLAASYAAAGRFPEAIKTNRLALDLAHRAGSDNLA